MAVFSIRDLNIPELAVYTRLTERGLRRDGVLIAESENVIRIGLEKGLRPLSFLMAERHVSGKAAGLIAAAPDIPVFTGPEKLLARLTGYALTRGVLCAMERPAPLSWRQVAAARRLAVLHGLTDASNVGAVFRSAAALGADGVLLSPETCDPLTRKALRVSMGAVLQVPWAAVPREDWPEAFFAFLDVRGVRSAALALDGSVPLGSYAAPEDRGLAVFFGSEGRGLGEDVLRRCADRVRIPMARGVDSLNVAASAAVVFWQLFSSSSTEEKE